MKKNKEYLNKIINENNTCILALSGGPDSMCLLHLLLEIKKEKNYKLICVHVNHNTREACEEEKRFVEDFLRKEKIPFEYYKIESYKKGKFTEEEGREKRYKFLKKIYHQYNADFLFTAHHGDDLTETILMRLLRGSTLNGYMGIKKDSYWDGMRMVRPLLDKKKKEILEYLKEFNIPYVIDESNEKDLHTRNKIRHKILPILEEIEPNYIEKMTLFSENLKEINNLLIKELEEKKEKVFEKKKIKKEEFLKLSKEWQQELLKEYLKEVYQEDLKKISKKHLTLGMKMLEQKKAKRKINFPMNKIFQTNGKYIWLSEEKKAKPYCIKIAKENILPNGSIVKQIENYEEKSNFEIHLNSKEITFPLYLTTRKPGMKMEVKNLEGTKKISDILINSKIPQEEKEEVPILMDADNKILWILGIKKSKYDLEKNENYDIIYKYIKKEG